jgi:regulator of sigma E protease
MMLVVGIFLFALLVVAHEFGHFLAARRSGVEVKEFGIGFPPRLFKRRIGRAKTVFSFNLIPLGGFVKLKGEADADTSPHSFGAARLRAKAKILLAGVGMNVVVVYVIILGLALTSLPSILPKQFTIGMDEHAKHTDVVLAQVSDGSAAKNGGLKVGDVISNLNGSQISSGEDLRAAAAGNAGKTVEVRFRHNGKQQSHSITLGEDQQAGYLGVVPVDVTKTHYGWSAPLVAAGITIQLLWLTLAGLASLIIGLFSHGGAGAAQTVTGPVGVFLLLQNVGNFGFNFLLLLIASISASLAVINALPIPALDGGRLAVILVSHLGKKRLSSRTENAIHGIGFAVLISLVIVISYFDVKRFF